MNAYELADELAFKHIAGDESGEFNSKLIVMLRQQADRIAELEKQLDETKLPAEFQKVLNDNLHELYEVDEKQSKPVAWMNEHGELVPEQWTNAVPLYNTPHYASDVKQTKPLKRLNKQEIARYMFSQNTGQDIGQMLIEYFCDKNGLTLEYIED